MALKGPCPAPLAHLSTLVCLGWVGALAQLHTNLLHALEAGALPPIYCQLSGPGLAQRFPTTKSPDALLPVWALYLISCSSLEYIIQLFFFFESGTKQQIPSVVEVPRNCPLKGVTDWPFVLGRKPSCLQHLNATIKLITLSVIYFLFGC